jgi:tetratricopeptide (TPR) repeat protein
MNISPTFVAAVSPPVRGQEGGYLPGVTMPDSVVRLLKILMAHPWLVASFLLLSAIGILIGIIIAIVKSRQKRLRQLALFKPLARLEASDLGIENYLGGECYIKRESDDALSNLLEEGVATILILGKPGSGKTRTAFEALKEKGDYYLLAPKPMPAPLKELAVPGVSKKKIVLFLDDIYRHIKKLDIVGLFSHLELKAKGVVFLATCSPDKLPFLEKTAPEVLHLFRPKNRIFLKDLTPAEQKSLADALGQEMDTLANVTPASLTLNLAEKKEQYRNSEDARLILHSLLLMNRASIFVYKEDLVRKVCQMVLGKDFSRSQWNSSLKRLVTIGLIAREDSTLHTYERYLEEDFITDYHPTERDIEALLEVLLQVKDKEGLISLGVYHSSKGQWEKALQALERAVELNPHQGEIRYLLGQSYEQMGMAEKALETYKEAVRYDNRSPKVYYALGTIYNEMYMVKEAVEALKRAVQLDPYHSRAYFQLALAFEKAGTIEGCLTWLREATRVDPDYTEAHRYLADLYQKRGQHREALIEYKELARINPDDEEAHIVLATAYNKLGKVNEALEELKELTRINPANLKAHYTLALTYYKKGMLEEAIKEFKDVLILNPEDHAARSNLALAYSKMNLLDEAIEEYKEILRLRPQEIGARYNLAQTYEKKGMIEEAGAEYKEILQVNPEHAESHYRLALMNLRAGLLEEATKGLKEVARLRPTHAMAHGQLAMIYQRQGLMAEARKEYRLYEQLRAR